MKRIVWVTLGTLAIVVGHAAPGLAQTVKGEFSGGWQYVHAEALNMPAGFYVDYAGEVSPKLAIVGEYGVNFKSEEGTFTSSDITISASADYQLHTFLGGLRYGAPLGNGLKPFGQALIGIAHQRISAKGSVSGADTFSGSGSDSATDFAFDLGGGVDAKSKYVTLRLGASYMRVTGDNGGNAFRLHVGAVIPF